MHLFEGAGKVKLVGKTKQIADLFDWQTGGIQQLHRPLHAQVIQVF